MSNSTFSDPTAIARFIDVREGDFGAWRLDCNPEVAQSGAAPLWHHIWAGCRQGYDPLAHALRDLPAETALILPAPTTRPQYPA